MTRASQCLRAILVAFLAVCVHLPQAAAQTAPAGNAHPESHAVTDANAESINPFGEPIWPSPATSEAKRVFAEQVDLAAIKGLAVFHNGRIKILDTLAKETVATITGRNDYFDIDADGDKLKYATMFTYMDLLIDPAYYVDKPLLHVNYLPLRRELLDAAFPDNPKQQALWMKLTRVSPMMVEQFGPALHEKHSFEIPFRQGFDRLFGAMRLYSLGKANLLLIAPDDRDAPWRHISTLTENTPARQAATQLGTAWRAGDAAAVNAAVQAFAKELPLINAEIYPTTKLKAELAYNRSNAFEWGYWIYLLSFISLLLAFGTGRRWLVIMGIATLAMALALHAFGFTARCFIAERFAIQNQFESMTGVSLFAVIVGTAIMLRKRQWLFGAAAAGTGFIVLIAATQTGIPGEHIEREAAILNTSWLLKYHVTTVLVSYGLIALGFIVSLFFLGAHYARKLRGTSQEAAGELAAAALNLDDATPKGRTRTLMDLDTAQMTVLQLAFWTLGVGILLGAWWADHSWGRWWAFDPKETWALATWIIYLIVIHVRKTTSRNRGLVTAWLSVLGFIVMLWTYFGVNLLLPGLHAYA